MIYAKLLHLFQIYHINPFAEPANANLEQRRSLSEAEGLRVMEWLVEE
jgi:hypothetical protein